VPVGYTGIASDNAAALVANAGQYNLELGNIVTGRLGNLRPADPRQESYGFSLRRMFGARVELLVDASRFFNLGQTVIGGVSTPFTLAANAPNNPFTTAVNIGFPATELSRTGESKTTADRLLAGVIVRLPAEWTAGADYVWSQSRTNGRTPQAYLGDPDGTGPGISYATALATGVLDVLRDLNRYPLDYSPYAMPDPFAYSNFLMRTDEVTARASGPIYALPAGKVVLSASAQFRWEDLPSSIGSTPPSSGTTPTYSWQPGVKLDARAYYAEVQVPVFAQTKPSGLRRGLDLQASVRRDEIDARVRASGSFITIPSPAGPFPDVAYLDRKWKATKATVGFKYAPLPDVTLRASWGSGFLAPALNQLSSTGPTVSQFLLTDPKRGNIQRLTTVTAYQSGSPSLQPEESESISAGLILTPRFWPGFRFSLDYTRIEKTDEIGNLSTDLLFRYEDRLPGRIVRAPLTPADQALGYTGGVIQVIDFRTLNIAGKRLTAYDLAADYTRKVAGWGEFNAYAAATYQPDFSTKPFPDVDYIQTAGGLGVVKWRGNGGITWTRGPLSLGWNMQYYHSYLIYTPGTAATTVATLVLNQGSPTIPSQVYHDLLATYRFGAETTGWRRYLAHTRLSVGVQNFLNTRPPPVATTAGNSAGFSSIGDPRLARYTLTVRKTF
jgi:outer membrane receptor protein involved in Fe transport